MISTEELARLIEAATPGPWEWGGHPNDIKLQTVHHGKLYIMDFVRKGFNGAQPRFQPTKRGMVNADALLMFQVGDKSIRGERAAKDDGSVYRYDVRGVDAPDARLIALAPDLASEVIRLRAQVAAAEKLAEAATQLYQQAAHVALGASLGKYDITDAALSLQDPLGVASEAFAAWEAAR